MPLSLLQYNILSLAVLLPLLLNLFAWQNRYVALIFGGVFFLFQSFILGPRLVPGRPMLRQTLFGMLSGTVLLLISSTIIYLVWDLSNPAQALAWLLFLLFSNAYLYSHPERRQTRLELHEFHLKRLRFDRMTATLMALYLLLALGGFVSLAMSASNVAIRSPWEVVPIVFWVFYFVATFILWILLWFYEPREAGLALLIIHLFLSFSVALIVYKLGYGYDSFIHKTSEQIIDSVGVLLPKTPYYLGQYSLIVSLHRLTGLSIAFLDSVLVPLLAAISLPLIASELLGRVPDGKPGLRSSHWLALALVLLPFSSFIVTTPQALANLFFLWIILALFPLLLQQPVPWGIPHLAVVGLAAMLTHPLTGIPSLILLGFACLEIVKIPLARYPWLPKLLWLQGSIMAVLAMPFLLWVWSLMRNSPVQLKTSWQNIQWQQLFSNLNLPDLASFMPALPTQFAYLAARHWPWLLFACTALVGSWLLAKMRASLLRVYLLSAASLAVSATVIATFFTFPTIAAYENGIYAGRMITLAVWCLLPFLLLGLLWLYHRPLRSHALAAAIILLTFSTLNTTSVYASYPRHNRFERSRQFSTSAADVAAVQYIDSLRKSDYVVLANQSVSAAAIAAFGFRTYYPPPSGDTPIFYYPVPTSSPLYGIYLDMVQKQPTRENARRAHELTGASVVYFVLNSYWDNAPELKSRAAMEADAAMDIANGQITVFTYSFGSDANKALK